VHIGDDRSGVIPPRGWGRLGCFGSVLGREAQDVGPDLGFIPMPLEKSTHPGARMVEQRLVDKFDGRRRALDVQEDGADALQRDAVRSGMYERPMQSGW
jgi:hypothetical protein